MSQTMIAMSRRFCVLLFGAALVAGCGELPEEGTSAVETRQSALIFSKQYVVVPAYFDPQANALDFDTLSDWDNHNSKQAIKSAIVNLGCEYSAPWTMGACGSSIAGGPGSSSDPNYATRQAALAAKIANLHASGIQVFGYVDYYASRPSANIQADLFSGWNQLGPITGQYLDGIYFDDADRSSSAGVARAEYWTTQVFNNFHPQGNPSLNGRVIFGYGTTHTWTGDYVRCVANYHGGFNWFVTQENTLSAYTAIDPWAQFASGGASQWMNGYIPDHFINIVNNDTGANQTLATMQDLANRSRILNAGQLYVTDGPFPGNTYGHLAQNSVMNPGTFPIFNYLEGDSAGDTAEYDHGGSSDPAPGSCPTEVDME
jgi:hypothetical protein